MRLRFAPKVPIEWIVRLYRLDALGIQDDDLVEKVGWRLHARCADVLLVSDSRVACPVCQTEFSVPWINRPAARVSACPQCGWQITAGDYHASFRNQDLWGINARAAFEAFVQQYPSARDYAARMLLIDRLIHATHRSGNTVARNLLEGHPRRVMDTLDALAQPGRPE